MKHNGGTIRKTATGYMAAISYAGRRTAHRTDDLKSARAWIDTEIATVRAGLAPLTPRQAIEYHDAVALLPAGASLLDAARAYAQPAAPCPTVTEAWTAFEADKRGAGLRPRTLYQLRFLVGALARQYGADRLDALTADRLTAYLAETTNAVSRNNHRRAWGGFFRWAIARGYIERNPIAGISTAKEDSPAPGIFTPAQAAALLHAATQTHPGLVPYLALGLYAGLRTAELMRLRWEDVSQERIHIRSDVSKMREERFVAVRPPLGAWLARHGRKAGRVCPVAESARDRHLQAIRTAAKLPAWPANGMRHSYASYLLAGTGDSALVAHQLGHHDPETTWKHYRHLVERAAAEEYFSLTPVAVLSRFSLPNVPECSQLFPTRQTPSGAGIPPKPRK